MQALLVLAGIGQIGLAIASLWLPRILGWRAQTARLEPLTRCVFWTYAGYILGTNLCIGLLSALAPRLLLDGSPLARCVCGYVAVYWGARAVLQLTHYHRHAPRGARYRLAEALVLALFVGCTGVYGALALDAA